MGNQVNVISIGKKYIENHLGIDGTRQHRLVMEAIDQHHLVNTGVNS